MIQTDWKLGRTEERCATCGHAFAEGETYVSALFELPSSDFRRGGYCERCYPPSDGEPFSFWRTRRSAPVRSKKLNLDQVKELFLRFVGSAEPADREVAYLLALLLMRKKRLRLKETRSDGETRWLVLESNLGEGPFPVADPVITAERLEALDREIRDLLVVG
jgi:hypothetical protein